MDRLEEFKKLYDEIKNNVIYIIYLENTSDIKEYVPLPDNDYQFHTLAKIPIYKKEFRVKELKLTKKDDLFSAVMGPYGERIFSNRKDAELKCELLNKQNNSMDIINENTIER